ncbi:MAG: DMT family transporter [Simkaniaceae bacterium]|nr:MAG: DMT family transporter [Simkaniaceae bacterium]
MQDRFVSDLRKLANIAKQHHHVPEIKEKTRHIGIIYTTIAWSLYAVFTILVEKLNPNFYAHVSTKSLSKSFLEFSIVHFSMLLVFFIWCLIVGGKKHLAPKEPKLITWRSISAVLSFWFYSLSRIWTNTIDNSLLYSTDAIWILLILIYLKVKIDKLAIWGIAMGFIGIAFAYFSDSKSLYDLFGGLFGLGSGVTLAIITVITTYLVKQDPPERIGLYQAIYGCISSLIISIIFGLIHGFDFPELSQVWTSLFVGIIFSVLLYWIWKSFYYTEPYFLGALSYILPVFLISTGWIMNIEPMNTPTLIGTAIITIGGIMVVLDSYFKHRKMARKKND